MFDIGFPEFFVLALLALIVFGPERLPTIAVQAARLMKSLRGKASAATAELTQGLDLPDVADLASDIQGLHPKRLLNATLSGTPAVQGDNAQSAEHSGTGNQVSSGATQPKTTHSTSVQAVFDPDAT